MTLDPHFSIGEKVKSYENRVTIDGVDKKMYLTIDKVKAIIIYRDILTNDYIYLYKLENGQLYNENNLMKYI